MEGVEVVWVDSISYGNEWIAEDRAKQLGVHKFRTRGFLLERNDDVVIVAQSIGDEDCHNIMVIPTGAVKEIIKLGGNH